ncbi:2'-5'-oligoadenylate synthase-like protein isoform X3 [Physeter macrocephalus]|uniref:2'-5'-oligoadenylate synthase-like protein isoform X3 n=1 Tax=Physeter macrocephalus TaxID=9755 RepID=A0A2Y9EPW0_PHYMC|nr:2'-5'-oligoadenylate synthase-like protein isoform X3 [Physeter catodon]|eukprot:XP_007106069.1 2'-5'-oligoadenylate synthase-like protein isoform X3 [Physeter catodon]
MAVPPELFVTPASRLNSFVAHCLHPSQKWKKEVLKTVQTVEQFLREQSFQGEHWLDQKLWVLKVVKVGSFGNGTVLRDSSEVELVMLLRGFHSFQEEARHHDDVLSLLCEKLSHCQDLLSLQLQDLRLVQGVPSAVAFTIQTWETAEPITVTIVPAYSVLGPCVPNSYPSPEVYVNLIKACGSPGHFSPSFSELQRNFVKHRPAKLKSLLRLVKHWYLEEARDIQVTVEQWGFSDFIVMVNPYDSIKKVKGKIQWNLGSTALQRLSFQEPGGERQLLSSQYSLADYRVFSNTRICLLQTTSPEIQVFVKNPSGGSHAYAIYPDSFVLNLKLQIEVKEGLLREEQQLEFQGQVLQDGWSLRSYGVQDSTTLTLKKERRTLERREPSQLL